MNPDIFTSLSLLLVFVVMYFSMYKDKIDTIKDVIIPNGKIAKQQLMKNINSMIISKLIPILFMTGFVWYLFLFSTIGIIWNSKFTFIGFDVLNTSLCFIELLLTYLLIILICDIVVIAKIKKDIKKQV